MSVRNIRWTKRSLARLDAIGEHIASDNPEAATAVVIRLVSAVDGLAAHPALGRIGRIAGTRELVITGLPYIVAYRVAPGSIDVLTVLHAAQKWPKAL